MWLLVFKDIHKQKLAEEALETLNCELAVKVRERTKKVRELAAQLTLVEARLAQVLHDDLQQQLYAVGFALHELRPHLQGDLAGLERLEGLKHLLEGAVATARTTTSNLSPPVLRHEGFVEALAWLGHNMKPRCLVVTGHVGEFYRNAALTAGAVGVVTKDDPDEVLRAVKKVLSMSESNV